MSQEWHLTAIGWHSVAARKARWPLQGQVGTMHPIFGSCRKRWAAYCIHRRVGFAEVRVTQGIRIQMEGYSPMISTYLQTFSDRFVCIYTTCIGRGRFMQFVETCIQTHQHTNTHTCAHTRTHTFREQRCTAIFDDNLHTDVFIFKNIYTHGIAWVAKAARPLSRAPIAPLAPLAPLK